MACGQKSANITPYRSKESFVRIYTFERIHMLSLYLREVFVETHIYIYIYIKD